MADLIELKTITDTRGDLTVLEKEIDFLIKRVFYINNVPANIERGGHRHKKTKMALICLNGSCRVFCNNGIEKKEYILDKSNKCLILQTTDWHTMHSFSTKDTILLCLASEPYDKNDYIDEKYTN